MIEGRARVRALVLSADSADVTAGTALSRAVSKSWDRSSSLETESSSEFTDELEQRSCWRTTLTPLHATGKKLKPLRVRWISAEGRAVWIILREKQSYFLPGLREVKQEKFKSFAFIISQCSELIKRVRVHRRGEPELSNPMTTANCPGNEELDFRLIFGEDVQQPPLGPSGQCLYFGILSNPT